MVSCLGNRREKILILLLSDESRRRFVTEGGLAVRTKAAVFCTELFQRLFPLSDTLEKSVLLGYD